MPETLRPPVLNESTLSDAQKKVYNAIASGPRGVVQGPLRIWLQSPALADKAQSLGAFCRYDTRLPPRLSELAILVTGSFWKSGFEWAIHAPIALEKGLSKENIEAIRKGTTPNFTQEDERITYEVSRQIHETHEVTDKTYARAIDILGQQAVVELVGILGYYTLISMTINAFRVPLPDGVAPPFSTK